MTFLLKPNIRMAAVSCWIRLFGCRKQSKRDLSLCPCLLYTSHYSNSNSPHAHTPHHASAAFCLPLQISISCCAHFCPAFPPHCRLHPPRPSPHGLTPLSLLLRMSAPSSSNNGLICLKLSPMPWAWVVANKPTFMMFTMVVHQKQTEHVRVMPGTSLWSRKKAKTVKGFAAEFASTLFTP